MNSLQDRLREERTRLGFTQEALASTGGVQRRAQANYENGTRSPDANYLQAIAQQGVDVGYVITGHRGTSDAEFARELSMLSDAWQALDAALAKAKKAMPSDKKRLAAEALYQAVKAGDGEPMPLAKLLIKAA